MLKVVWDVTNGIRVDLSQYGVVRGRTKRKLVGMLHARLTKVGEWSPVHKAR